MTNHQSSIVGCILGGAIGDAFGGHYEGVQARDIFTDEVGTVRFDNKALRLSDDTQLTLATCEAIIECGGEVDPAAIAFRFTQWYRENRVTGFGASTYAALTSLSAGGHWALVGRKGDRAAGNGAAMRIAPLAFCLDPAEQLARRAIRDVSRITHHHEEAYVGALAVVVAVRVAATGLWDGNGDLLRLVASALPDTEVKDRLKAMSEIEDAKSPLELAEHFGCSGYVVESVPLALCGAMRVRQLGFERMMSELIACGGDTDTIASIAGQISGTLLGRSGLPEKMVSLLPDREWVENIAAKFAEAVGV